MDQQTIQKTITIYPRQDFVIKTVAKQFEGNESMAFRHIINFYEEHCLITQPAAAEPAPLFDIVNK